MEKLNNMEGGKIQCTEKSFYLRFDIIFPRVEGDNALGYLHKDNKDISNLVTNLENFVLMFAFKIVQNCPLWVKCYTYKFWIVFKKEI